MKIIPLKPSKSAALIDRIWTWIVGLALMLAVLGMLGAVIQGVRSEVQGTDWYTVAWDARALIRNAAWSMLPRWHDLKILLSCVLLVCLLSPHLKRLDRLTNSLQQYLDEKNKPNA